MRHVALCLILAACEKAGGVEAIGGTSSHDETGPVGLRPKLVGTLPNDAGVIVSRIDVDAAVATVTSDAQSVTSPVTITQADAERLANRLMAGDKGKDYGDMSQRTPGADLGRQIDDARNGGRVAIASSGGTGRGSLGGSVRVGGGIGSIDSVGGGRVSTPSSSGRISVSGKAAIEDSTLTPDQVLAKIQVAYMAGIKRCYKIYLDKDASARGVMKLQFTVDQTGRTIGPGAPGFAKEVGDCITAQMTNWRFPVPKDTDGKPTTATFSIGLNMVPD